MKYKKLLLTAGILILIAITAAAIKFMPGTSIPVAKALPQKKSAVSIQKAVKTNPKGVAAIQPEVIAPEQNQAEKAEREEADILRDTPEKAIRRASLEKDIKELTEKKEKDEREYSLLMKSFDEAISNSQLPPEELTKKKSEIESIKSMLTMAYDKKMSSADASLKQKVEQYSELDQE